jgi:azurin
MKWNFVPLAAVALLASGQAWSENCALTVEANDQVQFVQRELVIESSCAEISVTLKHIGTLPANVMGHNWVLTETRNFMEIGQAGAASGAPNYVPEGETRIIAATKIIGGGEETTIRFDASLLQKDSDYTYFCSFPGHFLLMNGKLKVV